jgi:hypothetical protein
VRRQKSSLRVSSHTGGGETCDSQRRASQAPSNPAGVYARSLRDCQEHCYKGTESQAAARYRNGRIVTDTRLQSANYGARTDRATIPYVCPINQGLDARSDEPGQYERRAACVRIRLRSCTLKNSSRSSSDSFGTALQQLRRGILVVDGRWLPRRSTRSVNLNKKQRRRKRVINPGRVCGEPQSEERCCQI